MLRHLPNGVSSRLLSTPRLQVRVADNLAVWLRRTSIPKTFRQRWITWRRVRMWMPGVSASSASAAGEVLPSMRQPTIRVSRQPWPPPCTISAAVRRTVISMLPTMRTPVIKCVRSSMPSVRKIIAPALIPAP